MTAVTATRPQPSIPEVQLWMCSTRHAPFRAPPLLTALGPRVERPNRQHTAWSQSASTYMGVWASTGHVRTASAGRYAYHTTPAEEEIPSSPVNLD